MRGALIDGYTPDFQGFLPKSGPPAGCNGIASDRDLLLIFAWNEYASRCF